jgi:hypothetical protein
MTVLHITFRKHVDTLRAQPWAARAVFGLTVGSI